MSATSGATPTFRLLRTVTATRYVTPLREGGSLPAVVEADDDGLYVVKFRGAGQGVKALVAELVAGEIGRALGLLVPEIVFIEVDPALGRSEPDFEIQALLKASGGLNLALDYLPGALPFDPAIPRPLDPALAAAIVWFDAYITNVDRTPRNTNLLTWHKRLWLIDHGAALYFHHGAGAYPPGGSLKFARVADHVLLPYAGDLDAADVTAHERLHPALLASIVAAIPDVWLAIAPGGASVEEQRAAYVTYLTERLASSRTFVEEAQHARAQLV
ncbi:MAG TPA: HipA family kinase [Ktedonobacterales bacterium]|nr:HipA family kinase [Ktedonobacterales bacterium]